MKISIITASRNSAETIRSTIESVTMQTHDDIEHIIVDGASTDMTMEIVSSCCAPGTILISEPDRGIYDAMNKGIALASGEIIGILNSDDYYNDNTVLARVATLLEDESVDACYGDLEYVDNSDTDHVVRFWKSGEYNPDRFYQGWMPPHPTFFARKSLYSAYGNFNLSLGSSADYELMLRFLLKQGAHAEYIPEVLVKMRTGGASNVSLINRIKANLKDRLAWRVNGLRPHPWTLYLKPLSKLGQFFSEK